MNTSWLTVFQFAALVMMFANSYDMVPIPMEKAILATSCLGIIAVGLVPEQCKKS